MIHRRSKIARLPRRRRLQPGGRAPHEWGCPAVAPTCVKLHQLAQKNLYLNTNLTSLMQAPVRVMTPILPMILIPLLIPRSAAAAIRAHLRHHPRSNPKLDISG